MPIYNLANQYSATSGTINPYNAGIDFRRLRFCRIKSIPALKSKYMYESALSALFEYLCYGSTPILQYDGRRPIT